VGQQTASVTVLCKSLVAVRFKGQVRLFRGGAGEQLADDLTTLTEPQ